MSTQASEWQSKIPTCTEAGLYMRDNGLHTDCSFFVGNRKDHKELKAHSFILMGASQVFERMFLGEVPQNMSEINVPDFDPHHFELFLRALYMDNFIPETFEEACSLYTIADKYLVQRVMDFCISFILDNVSIHNAIEAYEFFKLFGFTDAARNCEQMIEQDTSTVISSKGFVSIEKDSLLMIMKKDYLNIDSEKQIYDAAMRWIEAEIMRKGIVEESDKEELYKEVLAHIRFLTMSGKDFARGPAFNPFMTKDDRLSICQKMLHSDVEVVFSPNICQKRRTFTKNVGLNEQLLTKDWKEKLWNAVETDDVVSLGRLKLAGADLSVRDSDGWSLLHRAVYEYSMNVTKWLLIDGSIDVDWVTTGNYRYVHEGSTALHMAASGGRTEIARFLIDAGADTTIRDTTGRTPLNIAEGCPAVASVIRNRARFFRN